MDLFYALQWWLILFSVGLMFFPLTSLLFHSFFDQGYALSKILGILFLSYASWFLSSLHILPFSSLGLFILLGVALIFNSWLSYRKKTSVALIKNFKVLALEEAIFLAGFLFWAWVRSFEPSIHGLEKFMDFGFINSILRTSYFPPKDLWLTPFPINYYYFGHLITAVLIKLSFLKPEIGYNLMLATLFALTLSATFCLGANLYSFFSPNSTKLARRRLLVAGGLAAFLVTLGGNLHTIYAFFQSYSPPDNPVPFWQLPLSFNFSGYWYPNATRFIPFTIHEFPIYSFVVADLHGHVLNIPFVLLIIALTIKVFHSLKITRADYALYALLVAVSLMTNVLDGPIYLLLIFLVILMLQLQKSPLTTAVWSTIKSSALIGFGSILFSLPFWANFKPFSSGIGVLCAPDFLVKMGRLGPFLFEANHCARSPLWMLTILWGFFYFVLFGFIYLITSRGQKQCEKTRFNTLGIVKKLKEFKPANPTDLLVLVLAVFATILILIPELVYVKDIYPAHYRANTVFKFGYQAFMVLGLICGYMIVRSLTIPQKTVRHTLYAIPLLFLFTLVAIYPYFATRSYYRDLTGPQSLDGLAYLQTLYPNDYQAVLWLRDNIQGQPVILEGQGDSYTDYARISSNTGLPTVIGWPVHEWLWRGSYDEAGKRSTEVTTLYESPDIEVTKQLLKKYNVSYVYIGTLERQKYTHLDEAKFAKLGKVIFQSGDTRIYQINQ
ncbi:MAG: DUF2298 domain-containing protein [Patescibacteria group bacterium]|nr:DUF2298 domain-containing protein [Patescibacteria group bacterium]